MDIFMHNIAYAAKEMDVRIAVAEKLHRPPFPTDPPLNFRIHLFKTKRGGSGMLTLPTQEVSETFLRTYGHTSIMVKGREIKFRLNDKPLMKDVSAIFALPPGRTLRLSRSKINRRRKIRSQLICRDMHLVTSVSCRL